MFCPNCGNNCGDAKFCVMCGTKIQQAPVAPATQTIVTVCPHCGGTDITGTVCSFCGKTVTGQEPVSSATTSAPPEIPYGTYYCERGAVSLFEHDFAIEHIPFFGKKSITRVPYNKLTKVVFLRSNTRSRFSAILFRWEETKHLPIPENIHSDKFSLSIGIKSQDLFYHIFYALKVLAPSNASFEYLRQGKLADNVKQILIKYNVNQYYDEFAPYRSTAIETLCKKAGFTETDSKLLIDLVFDLRQGMLYKEEPSAAIKDLNLIVAEVKQREELEAQKLAQLREDNARASAQLALEQLRRKQNE